MITGDCDLASFSTINDVHTMATTQHLIVRPTQCAHIFAPSTSQDISEEYQDGVKVKFFLCLSVGLLSQIRYSIIMPPRHGL